MNCNNITTSFNKVENETYKSYYNNEKTATLIYDGTKYILCKGSKLKQPLKTTNEYDQGLYERLKKDIQNFKDSKIIDDNLILLEDLHLNSPSRAGSLCSGTALNGWIYFKGLNELRGQ